jgi:hypothetical protein
VNFNSSSSGVDTWYPKAVFTQLVALSGGRLRPVRINPTGSGAASGGWPVAGGNFGQTVQVLVARGGSGYNPATTSISFASSGGGASPTATPVITNGVITGVTITSAGYYSTVGPQATITDTSGSGSGAVLTSIITGSGEYAVGGLDTVQAEAFIPGIIASGAKNVLWMCGTNNLSNPSNGAGNASGTGYTLAQTQASVLKSINAFVAAGIRPIVIAPLDRADSNGSSARQNANELRRWYVTQLPALVPGVIVVNPTPYVNDPNLDGASNGATGLPVAWTSDGLHCNSLGCFGIAQVIWNQLASYFPGPYLTDSSPSADYYQTLEPTGNLLPTALNKTGTTAVTSGETPWSGTRDAKVYLTRTSNCTGTGTAVASEVAHASGRNGTALNLAVSMTGETAGCAYRLYFMNSSASTSQSTFGVGGSNTLQSGWTIRAAIDELTMGPVSGQSATVGLEGIRLKLQAEQGSAISLGATVPNGSTAQQAAAWGDFLDTSGFPAYTGNTLFLQTRELTLNSYAYGVLMYLDFVCGASTCSFNANLYGASVRQVLGATQ